MIKAILQVHPRNDPSNPLTGVFRTHSRYDPACLVSSTKGYSKSKRAAFAWMRSMHLMDRRQSTSSASSRTKNCLTTWAYQFGYDQAAGSVLGNAGYNRLSSPKLHHENRWLVGALAYRKVAHNFIFRSIFSGYNRFLPKDLTSHEYGGVPWPWKKR